MRVHIQIGASSIEVEGAYDEVDKVLTGWWNPAFQAGAEGETVKPEKQKKPARKPVKKPASNDSQASNGFDPLATTNSIRNDARYDLFKRKIILGSPGRVLRAKFVSWFTHDKPLTSGNIHRVLQTLGVKIDPSSVSRGISDAKNDYLKNADGPQPMYHLSARAHHEFEAWLLNNDEPS